jgi:hypothetical protein
MSVTILTMKASTYREEEECHSLFVSHKLKWKDNACYCHVDTRVWRNVSGKDVEVTFISHVII